MLSRRRQLVQSNRRRQTGGEPSGRAQQSPTPPPELEELPPYEELVLPLNDEALQAVAEMANSRSLMRLYETQLKKSAEMLREAVGNINDLYSERTAELQRISERRRERGGEQPSSGETEITKLIGKLSEDVPPLTRDIERRARLTIDMQVELEDERDALTWTNEQSVRRQQEDRQRRRADEQAQSARAERAAARRQAVAIKAEASEGSDENMDAEEEEEEGEAEQAPPASLVEMLRQARETRAAEYARLDAYRKYGLNNDYITFKQTWHDAIFPDGEVVLPDASVWFDAEGQPTAYGPDGVIGAGNGGGGGDGDNSDDGDDLIVAREVISFKCPLMLITMTDPYKSRQCNHTFEKQGIMEYLQDGPKVCPQTGCSRTLSKSDLVPDKIMRRRIERAEQTARRRDEAATSDMEADDAETPADTSLVEGQARNVKKEKFMRR